MPTIILEGTDFSGKSTLAGRLKDLWEQRDHRHIARVEHVGPPNKELSGYALSKELCQLADETRKYELVIFDRFHWGMPIYGPIFRPDRNFQQFGDIGESGFKRVENKLHRIGALTVHVMSSLDELETRSASRGPDEYISQSDLSQLNMLRKLQARYIHFAAHVGLFQPTFRPSPIITGSWFDSDWSQLLSNVSQHRSPWMPNQYLPYYYDLIDEASTKKRGASSLLDEAAIRHEMRPDPDASV